MNRHVRGAFTLVELLVVIAIIAMLTALLVPAVNMAREAGRRTTCTNNQHELSLAITMHDTQKKYLPGFVNLVGGNTISWVPKIFPYLRNDLWEGGNGVAGWRTGASTLTPKIGQLICPNDTSGTGDTPLTYVVNAGYYDFAARPTVQGTIGTITTPGIFRDYSTDSLRTTNSISLADVKTPSRTVMLSEKIYRQIGTLPSVRNWHGKIGVTSYAVNEFDDVFCFTWPDPSDANLTSVLLAAQSGTLYAPLQPAAPATLCHAGVVIVTFCDGHTEALTDITRCNVYLAVP